MIFVTVGSRLPFDRLIETIDQWAAAESREDVFAQIGDSEYSAKQIRTAPALSPAEFRARCEQADVIIAHAGMGTILTALEFRKPIVVMPRRGNLGETRNDHQVDTAVKLEALGYVHVAADENDLREILARIDTLSNAQVTEVEAKFDLSDALGRFIGEGRTASREFDGVICFGGVDWWYHNRGHYDLQMMRAFSRDYPVLYVNSIGMRNPSPGEGSMFIKRLVRKGKSVMRGVKQQGDNFWVYSPPTFPRLRKYEWGRDLLARQVRKAARKQGMRNPLLWVAVPTAAECVTQVPHSHLVYQRTDRFEAFPGVDADAIVTFDRYLKQSADVTLYCSSLLYDQEKAACRKAAFVDHGVDYDRFAEANEQRNDPDDVRGIASPRVGFVGSIDAHTFDPPMFVEIAKRLPDCQFVLVGGCSLPPDWCPLSNVHLLGQKPYEQVAAYMAACDVLIMPWNKSEWIQACNPVKLKEYLAVGRPIVTSDFYELKNYTQCVTIARDADSFANAIVEALGSNTQPADQQRWAREHTWTRKYERVVDELLGVKVAPATEREAAVIESEVAA